MEENVERYRNIILSALEIHQSRKELKDKLEKLSELLTVREVAARNFDNKSAVDAFKILTDDVIIKDAIYVKSTLIFKSVEIHMFEDKNSINGRGISRILEGITIGDLTVK